MDLPILAVLDAIEAAARDARGFVLVAPPGAGKTTQVPRRLADTDLPGQILVVQPRRVAARSSARRLAAEDGTALGTRMGYAVRFDRRATDATRVVVVTEGILLRRLQADPFLSDVGAVLLDEFHERSSNADLALALLAEVQQEARPDLVVGVMSATLDPDPVARFLGGVPILRTEGRTFPLTLTHRTTSVGPASSARDLAATVARAIEEVLDEAEGDVLAFLPSLRSVDATVAALSRPALDVLPLHGGLSASAQDRALTAGSRRRVVVATNLAETSVTVPGVRVVVDAGLARQPRFDSGTGLDRLETVPISKASADQRAGRAGRVAEGRVVRLWSERAHVTRRDFDVPEIHRVDLAGVALQLFAWGTSPRDFAWFDRPPDHAIDAALELLERLGAVHDGTLGARGHRMAELPLHPRLARLVLTGNADARWVAAWLAEGGRGTWPLDLELTAPALASDAPSNVRRVAEQLERSVSGAEGVPLRRAILAAWPDRVALRRPQAPDRARMVGGRGVRFPESALPETPLIVAVDVDDRGTEGLVRRYCSIEVSEIPLEDHTLTTIDGEAIQTREERRYGDLVIAAHPAPLDPHAAAACVAAIAQRDLDTVLPDSETFAQLRYRIAFAHQIDPAIPEPSDDWLREQVANLAYGARTLAAVRTADWASALRDAMGYPAWQRLQALAPERLTLPSRSSRRLAYAAEGPPVLAVRMQELFGQADTPRVGEGRVGVLLHLLAPNGRPQQITDDLAGFWARTWPEVRKENRARYPKHAWPEDPLTAAPEARPQRRRRQ